MSRLSRSQLRIALTPTSVVLVRTEGWLNPRVSGSQTFVVEPQPGARPWEATVSALVRALPLFSKPGEPITLVLSNHFCHYLMLPALPTLASEEEDAAFARHTFREIYGETMDGWTIRVSGDSPAQPRLAAAIDANLLLALQRSVGEAKLKLRSVQPYLMAAFNAWHKELGRAPVWFALYEPGRLCISLCTHEGVRSVRAAPANDEWRIELPMLMQREANLQVTDSGVQPDHCLVFHPSQPLAAQVRNMPGHLAALTLPEARHDAGDSVQALAMALIGV